MAKLHEMLAALGTVKGQAEKTRNELIATFTGKKDHFREKDVTFQSLKQNADGSTPEAVTKKELLIQTTVNEELAWITGHMSKFIDAAHGIAVANTIAKADVILDGQIILMDMPATSLLELEKRASEVFTLVSNIPTLDPAKGFEPDVTFRKSGVFKAREVTIENTTKLDIPLTLAEATKEHPAQVKLVTKDVVTGKTMTTEYSGLITPAQKADMLNRVEKLKVALKSARARANNTTIPVNRTKIGEALLNFAFFGTSPASAGAAPTDE